jgi:hypothetical protein
MIQTLIALLPAFWYGAIIAVFALFCYILYRLDHNAQFKFVDFFTAGDWNGKASVARLGYFAGFMTHSLVLLHKEMNGGVDYALASLYALIWSGAYVALKAIELRTPTITIGDTNGQQQPTSANQPNQN